MTIRITYLRLGKLAASLFLLLSANGSYGQTNSSLDTLFEVTQVKSQVFNNSRAIRVLLPPGYYDSLNQNVRYPVLYMNDGFALFKFWKAKRTVYSLITSGAIEPIILVGIDNGVGVDNRREDRINEYLPYSEELEPNVPNPNGKKYPDFLINEIMPVVNLKYRTKTGARHTGIGGSSYGGYISLYTYLVRPDMFSRLLLESTPLFLSDKKIITEASMHKMHHVKIYLGYGTRETVGMDPTILKRSEGVTEEFLDILKKKKVKHLHVLQQDAEHTSKAWASRFPDALKYLYGNKTND